MGKHLNPQVTDSQQYPEVNFDVYRPGMDIYDVRREILIRILRMPPFNHPARGAQAQFATVVGISASYVSRMLNEPDSPSHKRIDTEVAQKIEDRLGLPPGTLLNPVMPSRSESIVPPFVGAYMRGIDQTGESILPAQVNDRVSFTSHRPLLSWGQVKLMLSDTKLEGTSGVTMIEAPEEAEDAVLIDMPDDSMVSPSGGKSIYKGDRLVLSRALAPMARPGQILLVCDSSGEFYIRRMKAVRHGVWAAVPLNTAAYESLQSDQDGLVVVAVVTFRRESLIDGL